MDAEAARRLHQEALVIDSHNDTIVAHVRRGHLGLFDDAGAYDANDALRKSRRGDVPVGTIRLVSGGPTLRAGAPPLQIDPAQMRTGGIDAAFFAIDVTTALKNHLTYALDGFGWFYSQLDAHPGELVVVRSGADLLRAKRTGTPAAILVVEHADGVEGSLHVLRMLYEIGVRSIGLTHNRSSLAADGCLEARDGVGLTRFGVDLVREMNRLGMLVDLAHVSPGGFYHALEVSDRPVIFSHGNAKALCPHLRNLDDDQLRALAANGGVIGVSFVPFFIDDEAPTLERLIDHIDHICEVAGVDAVGLGSDFDGGGDLLAGAAEVPRVTEALAKRNYSEEQIRKILGENTRRVLERALG